MGILDDLNQIDTIIKEASMPAIQTRTIDLQPAIIGLNELVRGAAITPDGEPSTMQGLEVVCAAFGALLDIYARPNAVSPEGMCDDPAAFRAHFADMLVRGGA